MVEQHMKPGAYARKYESLRRQIDVYHTKLLVRCEPLDAAEWLLLQALSKDAIVQSSYALWSMIEDMTVMQPKGAATAHVSLRRF